MYTSFRSSHHSFQDATPGRARGLAKPTMCHMKCAPAARAGNAPPAVSRLCVLLGCAEDGGDSSEGDGPLPDIPGAPTGRDRALKHGGHLAPMETGGSQGITVNPRKRGRGVNIERDVVRMHNENQRCVGLARLAVLYCCGVCTRTWRSSVRAWSCVCPWQKWVGVRTRVAALAFRLLVCGNLEAFIACCSCRCCRNTCAMLHGWACFMV